MYAYKLKTDGNCRADSTIRYQKFIESKTDELRDQYFERKIAKRLSLHPTSKRRMCARVISKLGSKWRNNHKPKTKKCIKSKSSQLYFEYVSRMCEQRVQIHYDLKCVQKKLSSLIKKIDTKSIFVIYEVDFDHQNELNSQIKELKTKKLEHNRSCKKCFEN